MRRFAAIIAAVCAAVLVYDLLAYALVSPHCKWPPWPLGGCWHTWHHVIIDGSLVVGILLALRLYRKEAH